MNSRLLSTKDYNTGNSSTLKKSLLIIMAIVSVSLSAQNQYMPFFGGFELGVGYSTFVDFNIESNGVMLKAVPYQLPFLPYQLGFVSAKYVNPTDYFELGIMFSKRSDSFAKKSTDGWSVPYFNLYCIDFPIKYYTDVKIKSSRPLYVYGGIIPSWIILPESGYSFSNDIDMYLTDWYLSVCSGICYDKGMLRWKLHFSMAVTSITKGIFRSAFESSTDYGMMVYPFEALICCALLFR
ncbi:MAG: hypothetical protein GY790_16975 [Bacteroidetes bacterium]|nr:hypothetical protein [Bacteroidota bacterium]